MKKILFIIALLSIFAACTVNETAPEVGNLDYLDYDTCFEARGLMVASNEPLELFEDGLRGQFSLTGTPIIVEETAPFSGEMVDVIYLPIEADESEYFDILVGSPNNPLTEGVLYFRLGTLDEDATVDSSAEIVNLPELLKAIESGNLITLNMLVVTQLGHGGNAGSVLPCVIVAE